MKLRYLFALLPCLGYTQTVDFDTILPRALQNNQELQAKKLDIAKAKASLKESEGMEFGVLKFTENITRTNHAGYVFGMKMGAREATFGDFGFDEFLAKMGTLPAGAPALLATQPDKLNYPETKTNFETKLTYSLPIFTGWKIQSAKDMMQLQAQATELKYKSDEKVFGLEIFKAYNGAVVAKEFIRATQDAKKATNLFITYAQELHKEGYVTTLDVEQAKVHDLSVDAYMSEAKNQFALALAYLKFLTDESNISDVAQLKTFKIPSLTLQTLQQTALNNRDDLAMMQLNTQTAKSKIVFDSSDTYPTIGLHMEYGFNDDTLSNIHGNKDYYLIATGLEYKLFDGFATTTAKEKAKIDFQKASLYNAYMTDGVKLQVEKCILALQTKQDIVKQKEKSVSLATQVLNKTEELYKNKLTTMTNLLLQQANLQKVRAEYVMAVYDESLAMAELKIALGESLGENK